MKALWRMSLVGVVGLSAVLLGPMGRQARPAAAALVVEANEQQPQNSDAMITAIIEAKFASNVLFRQAQVTIATNDGAVTLIGMVPSDFAHIKAMEIARNTPGVTRIDDQLRVNYNSPQAPSHN